MDTLSKSLFDYKPKGNWKNPGATIENLNASQRVFGVSLGPDKLAALVAAPRGSQVLVSIQAASDVEPEIISVEVIHKQTGLFMNRSFYRTRNGLQVFHNGFFREGHPKGTGVRVLARAVREYRLRSVRIVTTMAGRNPDKNGTWRAGVPERREVGYFVWPELGFRIDFTKAIIDSLPEDYSGATNSHDLHEKGPEALEWWRANGDTMGAYFDTAPASRHSRLLDTYLATNGIDVGS